MRHQICAAITLFLPSVAAIAQDLTTCAAIEDDAARLRCYDTLSHRSEHAPRKNPSAAELGHRWEQHLLADAARETFSLQPYQPSYALITHLQSFNYAPYHATDPQDQLSPTEIKFSFSLQSKMVDNLFGNDGDLWISYTQISYWQLFNTQYSSPFRETDYNPEARLAFVTDIRLPGLTLRAIDVGLRHDSNGQSGSLSRSWNRVFADFELMHDDLVIGIRPWVRVFSIDDNPDIEDYYGNFDLRASWEKNRNLFAATLRNPFSHHYGVQLSWSFPLAGRLRALAQWDYGYAENLIDYNHRNNRIGLGLLLSDWL